MDMKSKIQIDCIDSFIDGGSRPNYFENLNVLRDIKIVDELMGFQQPGKYKIVISIEPME